MKRAFIIGLAKLLALVAVMFVSTASGALLHRGNIPDELKK